MEYRQHQLENGLTILAECLPHSNTTAFGYFVKAGARDETPTIGGVSHFLEHMVFKGTPNRSAEEVNLTLDRLGSSSNARTGEESTIYHAAVLPEFQTEMVELLSDIMRPSLRLEDFETEKQVIIEEIMMYADQPPYGGHERIMSEFFGDHPLGQSVLGTVDTVSALTPESMKAYFQSRYSPGNIAIAAAGRVDFDRLIQDVERCCGHWEAFDAPRSCRTAQTQSGFHVMPQENATQQYILQLANGASAKSEDRFAARVLSSILGDDSGSRMYWKFLDTGLAESAGMGLYDYLDNGAVMTFLCCGPEQAQENLEVLQALQNEVLTDKITQKELDLAKRKISARIVLASERTENRMFSVGSQWLIDQEYLSVAEIAKRYESVTLDEVNDVAAKYPLTENTTLVVGPNSELQAAC